MEKISGQEFRIIKYKGKNCMLTELREPFWTAGKIYNWPPRHTAGVSLNQSLIEFALKNEYDIILAIPKEDVKGYYKISADKWLIFSIKTNSIDTKKNIKLYTCPWDKEYFKTIKLEETK